MRITKLIEFPWLISILLAVVINIWRINSGFHDLPQVFTITTILVIIVATILSLIIAKNQVEENESYYTTNIIWFRVFTSWIYGSIISTLLIFPCDGGFGLIAVTAIVVLIGVIGITGIFLKQFFN